ncbi:hypothetical protein KLU848_1102 [Kluyveromyces marxianus]
MAEYTLTYRVPQFQEYTISLQKYANVSNADVLRSKLMELPFAFIDARTVISVEQISSAIYKALVESTYNRMRTKTLHSECILSLSPSSNIGDALKRFGIKEDSTNLIVIKIVKNGDEEPFDGKTSIVGDLVPVSDEQFVTTADIETFKNVCIQTKR